EPLVLATLGEFDDQLALRVLVRSDRVLEELLPVVRLGRTRLVLVFGIVTPEPEVDDHVRHVLLRLRAAAHRRVHGDFSENERDGDSVPFHNSLTSHLSPPSPSSGPPRTTARARARCAGFFRLELATLKRPQAPARGPFTFRPWRNRCRRGSC